MTAMGMNETRNLNGYREANADRLFKAEIISLA